MTATTYLPPQQSGSALSQALSDHLTLTGRALRHALRSPDSMITAIALPVFILLLFVYVFGGAIHTGTRYLNYVIPGIILLSATWGASQTAVGVCQDLVGGIVDRFRAMAIAPSSVLTGQIVSSAVRNLASTAIVIGVALAMGFRPSASVTEWLAAIGMITLFVLAVSWLCACLGLLAKSAEAAGGYTFTLLFLPYVSSAFVPVGSMPTWLRGFAEHQPVTPVIETVRGLLSGTPIGSSAWIAVIWCLGLGAAGFVAATRLFHRTSA
jgi:ABC-2 type transport system permease protein